MINEIIGLSIFYLMDIRKNMPGNNRHLSILALNVNDLSAPTERYRIANWAKKKRPNHMLLKRDSSH
jgi:hypothetical protein